MNKAIKDYMNYEFPSIMETNPETIESIMLDYFDDVKSINGLGYVGDEVCEDMMCYVQDRLINEKWESEELTDAEITSIDDRIEYYFDNNEYTEDIEELAFFVMDGGEIDDSKYDEVINYITNQIK
jgi:hypothetical protein